MRVGAIVDRLREQCPSLRQVIPALTGAVPSQYPAAYIFPVTERADGNVLLGAHDQRIIVDIAIEIMVRHAAEAASGGPAQESLEDVRDEVHAALAGFAAEPGARPLDYVEGRVMSFEAGLAVWRDTWRTEIYRRQ
jgi:hypothetical protein